MWLMYSSVAQGNLQSLSTSLDQLEHFCYILQNKTLSDSSPYLFQSRHGICYARIVVAEILHPSLGKCIPPVMITGELARPGREQPQQVTHVANVLKCGAGEPPIS
ncbi:protein of unknown function [Shewanella benthica]|uniref:Uncharacterized protein n=1 Tax=Shewanella benthica TaxID=43661 RepID=A0A330M261_9GAMM|nr:protein of unknown function [Shewanella benthica]